MQSVFSVYGAMCTTRRLTTVFLVVLGLTAVAVAGRGQGLSESGRRGREGFVPTPSLVVPHAAIDPVTGDLLIISNSWPTDDLSLRRFHPDGSIDPSFRLERCRACCAIRPSLVAVDSQGNIYTLEYVSDEGSFSIYKHAPSGESGIDWGQSEPAEEETGRSAQDREEGITRGGFEAGETTLGRTAKCGRLRFPFTNPVDLIARDDGSLLVLDSGRGTVYSVDPDGRSAREFIFAAGPAPVRPFRLLPGPAGNLFLVAYYDYLDPVHRGMVGVFKYTEQGELVQGWGECGGCINDPYRPHLDFRTLITDGSGVVVVLGGEPAGYGPGIGSFEGDAVSRASLDASNHRYIYRYDPATGAQLGRDNMQYMLGYDSQYLGVIPALDSGLVLLQARDFSILVNRYSIDGIREEQVVIRDLYPVE